MFILHVMVLVNVANFVSWFCLEAQNMCEGLIPCIYLCTDDLPALRFILWSFNRSPFNVTESYMGVLALCAAAFFFANACAAWDLVACGDRNNANAYSLILLQCFLKGKVMWGWRATCSDRKLGFRWLSRLTSFFEYIICLCRQHSYISSLQRLRQTDLLLHNLFTDCVSKAFL